MLHIMDYTGRQDFNNPLVIMAGSGGLWIALSGFWLLVTSFRLGEFVPKRWRPARALTVFVPDGTKLRSVESPPGDRDRKRVGEGKSMSVSVYLGGSRSLT